jgi:hypothetical protein
MFSTKEYLFYKRNIAGVAEPECSFSIKLLSINKVKGIKYYIW